MKITILGFSGAGKSTLAAALGRRYGLPVLHLDRVHFAPGWAERTQPAQQADVAAFLDANSETGWVIDGNYTNLCYDRRLVESDRILILAFGRWACLRRVMERTRRYRGKTRPDMREGCTEKLDAEFVRWVLWDGRTKERRARFTAVTAAWPAKAEVLRSQRDLDRLYQAENLDPPQ